MTYTIRDAHLDDFETLWRLDQECFPDGIAYTRQELKYYVRRRGAVALVAVADPKESVASKNVADRAKHAASGAGASKIAGFIVAQGAQAGNGGHIITIDVAAAARRSGAGSQLLRAAEERLAAAGSKVVVLETAADNAPAQAFYKRHGYTVIKTMPRYYSNGMDALALKKDMA